MFGKTCPSCGFQFTMIDKPRKETTAICPTCLQEVKLGDAKELPESPATTAKEEK